jgi:hypothetical protein
MPCSWRWCSWLWRWCYIIIVIHPWYLQQ